MTVNELLSAIQNLKNENKISGDTEIITFDVWQDEKWQIRELRVEEDGKLMLL